MRIWLLLLLFATGCNLSPSGAYPYQKKIDFLASKGFTVTERKGNRFVAYKNGIRVEVEVTHDLYIVFK